MDFGPASADRSHILPSAGAALQSILTAVTRGESEARSKSEEREDWGSEGSMVRGWPESAWGRSGRGSDEGHERKKHSWKLRYIRK